MCLGGGNKSAKEAASVEAARQARISSNVGGIRRAFASPGREAQLQDFLGATRDLYTGDLNRQKVEADRNTRFALARSGTAGGSADIDANAGLARKYSEGLLTAERQAQGQVSGLRQADTQAEQNLTSLATAGANITDPALRAQNTFDANLQSQRQAAADAQLSNFFGDLADINKTSLEQRGKRDAQREFGTLFSGPAAPGGR